MKTTAKHIGMAGLLALAIGGVGRAQFGGPPPASRPAGDGPGMNGGPGMSDSGGPGRPMRDGPMRDGPMREGPMRDGPMGDGPRGRDGPDPRGGGPGGGGPGGERRPPSMDVMRNYIELVERYVKLSNDPDAAAISAVLAANDLLRPRGSDAAIAFFKNELDKAQRPAVKRAIRLQLIDLYRVSGRTDDALKEIEALVATPADEK